MKSKGMGCVGKFLVFTLIAGVVLAAIFGIGGYFAVQKIKEFTSDQPKELPVATASPEISSDIKQRFLRFKQALESGGNDRLELTADELNIVIATENDFEKLKGHCHFEIQDQQLFTEASLPLDFIPGFQGRYFNGKIGLSVGIQNGNLQIYATQLYLKDQPISEDFMKGFRSQNLAENTNQDPGKAEIFKKMTGLSIEGDRLVMLAGNGKPQAQRVAPPPPPTPFTPPPPSSLPPVTNQMPRPIASPPPPPKPTPPPPPKKQTPKKDETHGGTIVIEGYDPPPE